MLTVHAEGALLLMSDSQGVKILKIYYRELVIHSNLVVICLCQGIDISGSKGGTDSEEYVDIQRELICTNISSGPDDRSALWNRKFVLSD